jgi:hypothetical protein
VDRPEAWEQEVARVLDLDLTITSGNKFYDPGDATSRGRDDPFPLFADAKFTQKGSFSLKAKELRQWSQRASEAGKRFVLPLRFHPPGQRHPDDYVVMSFHDFVELRDNARRV